MPSINDIVRVDAQISAASAIRRDFGRTLLLHRDENQDAGGPGKVLEFSTLASLSARLGSNGEAYRGAAAYFAQSPFPRNLLVARWAESAVATTYTGSTVTLNIGTLEAITDGSLNIGGTDVTGIDFDGDTDNEDIAASLQAGIRAVTAFGNVSVAYTNGQFVFSLPAGATLPGNGVVTAHSGGSGTDVAQYIGMGAPSILIGHATETIGDALSEVAGLNADFYWVALDRNLNGSQAMLDAATWVNAGEYMLAAESNEDGVYTTAEESTNAYTLSQRQAKRTFLTCSRTADYKALSAAGRMSGVNFSGANTLPTLNLKTLPGRMPDELTPGEVTELRNKRANHYVTIAGTNVYREGWTLDPGTFVDSQYWIDWFVDAVRKAVFNLLRSSTTRIPQTAAGTASLQSVIEAVCEEGVQNGGIAPGTVSASVANEIRRITDNADFDGDLSTGYLVFIGSVSDQSAADRAARKAPPASVFLKGAGAIHSADIVATFLT